MMIRFFMCADWKPPFKSPCHSPQPAWHHEGSFRGTEPISLQRDLWLLCVICQTTHDAFVDLLFAVSGSEAILEITMCHPLCCMLYLFPEADGMDWLTFSDTCLSNKNHEERTFFVTWRGQISKRRRQRRRDETWDISPPEMPFWASPTLL